MLLSSLENSFVNFELPFLYWNCKNQCSLPPCMSTNIKNRSENKEIYHKDIVIHWVKETKKQWRDVFDCSDTFQGFGTPNFESWIKRGTQQIIVGHWPVEPWNRSFVAYKVKWGMYVVLPLRTLKVGAGPSKVAIVIVWSTEAKAIIPRALLANKTRVTKNMNHSW